MGVLDDTYSQKAPDCVAAASGRSAAPTDLYGGGDAATQASPLDIAALRAACAA